MKTTEKLFFFFFKILVIVTLAAGIFWITGKPDLADISLEQLSECLLPLMDTEAVERGDSAKLRQIYGINVNDYEEVLLYAPVSNMDVEELLLVKVKENTQIEMLESAVSERIREQKVRFDGYGTNQMGLLEKAETVVLGNYILFIVSERSSEGKEVFCRALKVSQQSEAAENKRICII